MSLSTLQWAVYSYLPSLLSFQSSRFLIFVLVGVLTSTVAYGQQPQDTVIGFPTYYSEGSGGIQPQGAQSTGIEPYPEPIPLSPNAAALEEYGSVPVGYHTGVPQVSVPLGQVTEGVLTVPINLSYHAAGLKVMETSSWVGAGWSLITGGAITRSVRGLPDEKQDFGRSFAQQYGYYDDSGFSSYVNDDPNHPNFGSENFSFAIGGGVVDAEPDHYYIQVPGFSGKFYFNDDQSVIFQEATDVKVVPFKGSDGGFERWEVILPSGTRYTFAQQQGRTDPIAERTYTYREESGIGANFRAAVSSWLLTEIASADRQDIITFHYVAEEYGFHTLAPSIASGGKTATRIKNSVRGWRLSEIRYSHGKVVFQPASTPREDLSDFTLWNGDDEDNTSAYALQSVEWQDNSGDCYRRFNLNTSYFNSASPPEYFSGDYQVDSDKKRLKLDEVQEVGCGTLSKPPYVFTYYQEAEVPRRLSYAQDHWGFHNGATSNSGMLPEGGFRNPTGPQRESQFPAMRAGSLQQIQYPTGGTMTLDYEANQVWRKYQEDVLTETPTEEHKTTIQQSQYKTTNLPAGQYVVRVAVSSQDPAFRITLSGRQNGTLSFGGDFVRSGVYYSEVLNLSGEYVLEAGKDRDNASGNMKIFAVTTQDRDDDFTVGGLRIKTITSDPGGDGKELVQRFDYTKTNSVGGEQISSAALYGRPVYQSYVRNDYLALVGDRDGSRNLRPNNDPNGCYLGGNPNAATLTSIFGIFPLEEVQGYHIGYEVVTEQNPDGGHTVYNFDVSPTDDPLQSIAVYGLQDVCNAQTPNYPPAPRPYNPEAGRLFQSIVRDASGFTKQLTLYEDVFEEQTEEVPGLIYGQVANAPFITKYTLKSHKLTSQTVTTSVYDQDDENQRVETVTRTEFGADQHALPTQSTQEVNRGTRRQEYSYPPDFTRSTRISESSRTTYQQDLQANLNAFNQATSNCGYATACWYNAFKEQEQLDLEARGEYAQRNVNERGQAIANLATDYASASPEYQAIINLQANNQIGQPLETVYFEGSTFLQARYQQYDDQKSVRDETASEVYPSQSFLIQRADAFTPMEVTNGNVSIDASYTLLNSQRYEQGKLVEMIGRDGVPMTYLWGYDYTLPVARVVGAVYNTTQASVDLIALQSLTGQALRSELNALRSLPNALVTTYTYDPLRGMTSQTGPDGITSYFEYDALSRLRLVRDQQSDIVGKYEYHYAPAGSQ